MLYSSFTILAGAQEEKVETVTSPFFSSKVYDRLKEFALIWLPGLGTLYFTVASIWNLPNAAEVVGTITAIDTFLGLILHVSIKTYNKSDKKYDGDIKVVPNEDGTHVVLGLDDLQSSIADKSELTLKVIRE